MLLKHLQLSGRKPIILLGGFTGQIGDPAGKATERKLLTWGVVQQNMEKLRGQFAKFLDFDCGEISAEIVDNAEWLNKLSLSDFLREVGKHFNISTMIKKDSVKSRIENGLSFTEFTYQLFQAYDFYHLNLHKNCRLQMGGSDQWGNIMSGYELIRKKMSNEAFALTAPLLVKPDGNKFGKSEEGNIWLDPELTSPYKFYQFWLNVDDSQIGTLLRLFTLIPVSEIKQLEAIYETDPMHLKRLLAKEVTTTVHSAEIFEQLEKASKLLYSKSTLDDFETIDEHLLEDITQGLPKHHFNLIEYQNADILETVSLVFDISKTEVKRQIKNDSLSINKSKVKDSLPNNAFRLLKGKYLLIQKGKTFGLADFN
jgi:tyrosyl-tRNA synthetase